MLRQSTLADESPQLLHPFFVVSACCLDMMVWHFYRGLKEAMSGDQIRQWSNLMQVSSPVNRAESRGFRPGRKTATAAATRGTAENGANAPLATDVMKIRGCRVSAPLMQPWGECCRIVEWINRNGEYSCVAVPGAATVAEIRERVRMHRNGQRHTLADDPSAPAGRGRLRRG
ncbi:MULTISPECIES: DUF2866 domain-containing protein [Paraburkholderia]|jgi:hypothetical protein|nr:MULTISPECIES: DUF2866 domain-containing protein [Paraburkholderia]MCX4138448.1 DUF2866 domain-containing protein [Paraburkholderia aspalathi]MDN7171138.1 DUF2866 domain-containing protein [Paraburkholderia sp. SEWSISQ10-3 4]MDQ6500777.1 DUF2866 domain-containing protein [Paraburkholderia aspalathi]